MLLDDRKRRILKAIIDDYIDTAEPVGSRTIARKHEIGLSSATIRNEMADLEEMGYLTQPHVSAGRIPSDKGYRYYVDQLMNARELTKEEIDSLGSAMEIKINELSQLIRQASAVISHFTRYTSVALTPQMKKSTLKTIQVVPMDYGKALVIVVTDAGIARNSLVRINEKVSSDLLIKISNVLNEKLCGLSIGEIPSAIVLDDRDEAIISKNVLTSILSSVRDCINQIDNAEVYLEGTTNILNYPEFSDIIKAKELLNILDEKELLHKLFGHEKESDGIRIQIGSENRIEEIKDCSLITTTYSLGNKVVGTIGIIGPTRMKYPEVISSLHFIGNKINEEIEKLIGEFLNGD